jgi:hypothetical protein
MGQIDNKLLKLIHLAIDDDPSGTPNYKGMKHINTPHCGTIHAMIAQVNKVKCVFFSENDSIIALDLVCVDASGE